MSGLDFAKRISGERDGISDKYLRNAVNAMVSAGARAEKTGSQEEIDNYLQRKSNLKSLIEQHITMYRKEKQKRVKVAVLDDAGNVIGHKWARQGSGTGEGTEVLTTRKDVRGISEKGERFKDELAKNLKNFINEHVKGHRK